MRYVLIVLGLVTTALAVALAVEGLWWAALPTAFFGVGIPWVAWVSLRDEQGAHRLAPRPEAEAAPRPSPEPIEITPALAPEPPPLPLLVSPPVYPRPATRPAPVQARRKKRR